MTPKISAEAMEVPIQLPKSPPSPFASAARAATEGRGVAEMGAFDAQRIDRAPLHPSSAPIDPSKALGEPVTGPGGGGSEACPSPSTNTSPGTPGRLPPPHPPRAEPPNPYAPRASPALPRSPVTTNAWQVLRQRILRPTRNLSLDGNEGRRAAPGPGDAHGDGDGKFSWRNMSISGWTRPSISAGPGGGQPVQVQQPQTAEGDPRGIWMQDWVV